LLIADIAMPEMDGLALTREVRKRAELKALPIILVSTTEDPLQRDAGLAAGADAFVSKKDCISGRLIAEAEDVISRRRGHA
jgi:two-component system chemotaxis sensor kinase CheA